MEAFSSGKIFNYKFGGRNIQISNQHLIVGDFLVSYCKENHIYLICRHDNKPLTGSETTGDMKYVDGKFVPIHENLEQKLASLIMCFTGGQQNAIPFTEFYYEIKENNYVIVVYPQYLDKQSNIQIKMNTNLDEELTDISLNFGTEIICLGPLENLNRKEKTKKKTLIQQSNTDKN